MANGDGKITKVDKVPLMGYKVLGKPINKVMIKRRLTDSADVDYYVYDLIATDGTLMALNRYVVVSNFSEQPFEKLTEKEELILKPLPEVIEELPNVK